MISAALSALERLRFILILLPLIALYFTSDSVSEESLESEEEEFEEEDSDEEEDSEDEDSTLRDFFRLLLFLFLCLLFFLDLLFLDLGLDFDFFLDLLDFLGFLECLRDFLVLFTRFSSWLSESERDRERRRLTGLRLRELERCLTFLSSSSEELSDIILSCLGLEKYIYIFDDKTFNATQLLT